MIADAQATMSRIGHKLLDDAHTAAAGAGDAYGGRDLLSLLVKANTAPGLAADHRMSDTDVLAQVPTFLVAGHETTRCALSLSSFVRAMLMGFPCVALRQPGHCTR